ncbi:hypothetical protein FACS1894188_05210 [Clostridia bacterium]|nr:hypothetical protein FACS1894188_05210 [Clostridia bacterium]
MKINISNLLLAMAKERASVEDVCLKSGVSNPAFIKIKSGKQNPRPSTLGKIAKALNVSVEYLTDMGEFNE